MRISVGQLGMIVLETSQGSLAKLVELLGGIQFSGARVHQVWLVDLNVGTKRAA